MELYYLAFSARGLALAQRLAAALGGQAARCAPPVTLDGWTREHFAQGAGLVYIGACGIAVRAAAPYLRGKETDPAVVAVDERGRYAVPLLSGHLGGANALARAIGRACGAQPVITTATDAGGLFPVDDWARRQGCAVADPGRIKAFSARLLPGQTGRLYSDWPIAGQAPAGVALTADKGGCDAALTLTDPGPGVLWLAPRAVALGAGCRRGAPAAALEEALAALLRAQRLCEKSVCGVFTIDRKGDEPGLRAFCAAHGWPLVTYTAAELAAVPGSFTPSDFVARTVGVDNVCERAAVRGAGGGRLLVPKRAGGGVTLAAAVKQFTPDWEWME